MNWLHRIVVVAGVGAAVSACGGPTLDLERVQWSVSEEASGPLLSLLVYAGGSSRMSYEEFEVDEADDALEIRTYLRVDKYSPYSEDIQIERVTVELAEPLGDRDLSPSTHSAIRSPSPAVTEAR